MVPSRHPVVAEFTLLIPSFRPFDALSASIVVGFLVLPVVASIGEDALRAVLDSPREAACGSGSTRRDVLSMGPSLRMPYDPGVLGDLAESSQTITAAMVHIAGADPLGGVTDEAMFAIGTTRYAITSSMVVLAEPAGRRFGDACR